MRINYTIMQEYLVEVSRGASSDEYYPESMEVAVIRYMPMDSSALETLNSRCSNTTLAVSCILGKM